MADSASDSNDKNFKNPGTSKGAGRLQWLTADVTFPAPCFLPRDLQRLEEDPVIRPMLIGAGVSRHLWPEGVITGQSASALIGDHQLSENGTA